MRPEHLARLVCPVTHRPLRIAEVSSQEGSRIKDGLLVEPRSGNRYPIVRFVPRFIPGDTYARSFGVEWNAHRRTQYDNGTTITLSRDRFVRETQWSGDLSGESMLEVGSGSGRFTRHALETGALVYSLDASSAVDANFDSNGAHDRLVLLQASVYRMPFEPGSFDRAFCFGVLQHTPDPRGAFRAIVEQLRPGGRISSDVYVKDLTHWLLQTKYWVRPFIPKSDPERLYRATSAYVDLLWPLARLLRRIPKLGYALNWRLLIADYSKLLPDADDETLKEWARLDTFDMLSPVYDAPQTLRTYRRWHEEAGLVEIDVHYGFNGLEGRAVRGR